MQVSTLFWLKKIFQICNGKRKESELLRNQVGLIRVNSSKEQNKLPFRVGHRNRQCWNESKQDMPQKSLKTTSIILSFRISSTSCKQSSHAPNVRPSHILDNEAYTEGSTKMHCSIIVSPAQSLINTYILIPPQWKRKLCTITLKILAGIKGEVLLTNQPQIWGMWLQN